MEALLRKPDYPQAFTYLLATTVAAKRDDYWFMVGAGKEGEGWQVVGTKRRSHSRSRRGEKSLPGHKPCCFGTHQPCGSSSVVPCACPHLLLSFKALASACHSHRTRMRRKRLRSCWSSLRSFGARWAALHFCAAPVRCLCDIPWLCWLGLAAPFSRSASTDRHTTTNLRTAQSLAAYRMQVLAKSDSELGGVNETDREAVEVVRQALRDGIEQYCLVD